MTSSKGPQVRIQPWAAAARPKPFVHGALAQPGDLPGHHKSAFFFLYEVRDTIIQNSTAFRNLTQVKKKGKKRLMKLKM